MKTLHFSIQIHAPQENVWHTMLDQESYREWTKVFDGNSHYKGNWEEGSEMRFIGGPDNEPESGMYSRIKVNREYEFISIEHLGMITNGVVDTTSDEVKKWTPAFENYTLTSNDDGTLLTVELDSNEEFAAMFEDTWPKALDAVKVIAER